MAAVASSVAMRTPQQIFKDDVVDEVLAQFPPADNLDNWIFETCGKQVEKLSSDQRTGRFVSAALQVIRLVATTELDILAGRARVEQSLIELGDLLQTKFHDDCKEPCKETETEDEFVELELELSAADKTKLLKQWIQEPFLLISEQELIQRLK